MLYKYIQSTIPQLRWRLVHQLTKKLICTVSKKKKKRKKQLKVTLIH